MRYILTLEYDFGTYDCSNLTMVLPISSEMDKDAALFDLIEKVEALREEYKTYCELDREWMKVAPKGNAKPYNGNNQRVIEKRNKDDEVFSTAYQEWLNARPTTKQPTDRLYFGGQEIDICDLVVEQCTIQTVDEWFSFVENGLATVGS